VFIIYYNNYVFISGAAPQEPLNAVDELIKELLGENNPTFNGITVEEVAIPTKKQRMSAL